MVVAEDPVAVPVSNVAGFNVETTVKVVPEVNVAFVVVTLGVHRE